ncbi:MAG TPA: hypothetical protein VGL91_10905 [Acidobacteriota bacterium]|jgi:hypothetical protein
MKLRAILVPVSALIAFTVFATVPDTVVRDLLLGNGLPARIKSKKKIARWDQIDQVLNQVIVPKAEGLPEKIKAALPAGALGDLFSEKIELRNRLASNGILFSELFQMDDDSFLPLTNSVLKLAPESSLEGLPVFSRSGESLGTFAGKTRYERSGGLYSSRSYTLITFQYKAQNGEFRSAGNNNLLDNFLVRWKDVKDRPALDLAFLVSP